MTRRRIWLLPVALGAAQLAVRPGLAGAGLVLLIAAALAGRRRFPVAVTAVVAAGIGLGAWLVPGDALLVISTADLVALFSVATLRSRRTTIAVLAGLTLGQAVLAVVRPPGDPADVVLTVCLYALVAVAGRGRRRWHADRSEAARRLAAAERARLGATAAERSRLARELHDVTAHHLTSIVVSASAAQYLGDRRPELRAEALAFAARTGRDTLVALHRLVAVLPFGEPAAPAPAPGLADLAADFRRLGQPVTLTAGGGPPPEAIHTIAREAMTNTLRHAPGGPVRLTFTYGRAGAELIVDDDGPADPSGPDDRRGKLGGGRGLAGMRERAEAVGGTLHAGPRPGGGWRVHAVLPIFSEPARHRWDSRFVTEAGPARRWWGSRFVTEAGVIGLILALPAAGVAVAVQDEGLAPAAATLTLLAAAAHAAPLLWRGRYPWAVLAAVALTAWAAPPLVAAGGWPFLLAAGADLTAVYAVATRGARPALTWIAPVAATTSSSYALGVIAAIDSPAGIQPVPTGPWLTAYLVVVMAMVSGPALAVPFGAAWLTGRTARRRRELRQDREEGALAAALASTELRTRAERARVAAGLRAAVLTHTAGVPEAAAAADLPGVLGSARSALTGMRTLLDGLDQEVPTSRPE
jgi:signal transduction histidine kinase